MRYLIPTRCKQYHKNPAFPRYGIIIDAGPYHLFTEASLLEGLDLAHRAVEIASDKQATDIVLLDTRGICSFADYFVICSAESTRQLSTIYEEIEHALKKEGVLPHHHEGTLDSGWLLIDYGDVVIHIFAAFEREFYNLDELWDIAPVVVRIQ